MDWAEVLGTATYTSPSGKVTTLHIETATQTSEKKTTTFTFPGVAGAYVQDLGRGGRVFPISAIFHGADYPTKATEFMASLEEIGQGKLEHPVYGSRVVVPIGSVSRQEGLVEQVGVAVVSVSFAETLKELTFPVSSEITSGKVSKGAENFQSVASLNFASSLAFASETEKIESITNVASSVDALASTITDAIPMGSDIAKSFTTILSSFRINVMDLATPLYTVGNLALMLIRTPARLVTPINTQIDGFGRVIANFIGAIEKPDGSNIPFNRFITNALLVRASFVALCESMLYGNIRTRPEAVYAAVAILDINDKVNNWVDENISSLSLGASSSAVVDVGETYNNMQMVVSHTVRYLIEVSFGLPMERRVVLQDDRQVLELLPTLGLSIESDLDFFIQSNRLTSDTIEIIPAGTEVLYYV